MVMTVAGAGAGHAARVALGRYKDRNTTNFGVPLSFVLMASCMYKDFVSLCCQA